MVPNCVSEVLVGAPVLRTKERLQIAYPVDPSSSNCITVICGRNNTGKTHILRELAQAFDGRGFHASNQKVSLNVHAVLTRPDAPPPTVLYLPDLPTDKRKVSIIRVGPTKHDPGGRTPRVREASRSFVGEQLKARFGARFDPEKWSTESEYRTGFIALNLQSETIYACDEDHPVVREFEDAVGGRLYFGRKGRRNEAYIEFALRYGPARQFYFANWSDGQKALFFSLLVIHYERPDLVLVDEIENHLHPAYITRFARTLKQQVRQSIIVTHHPHLLFSDLVDRVYYIELADVREYDHPIELRFERGSTSPGPGRRICELVTDFQRISAAYGLFDSQDRQLLHLAQATSHAFEQGLSVALAETFVPEVKSAEKGFFVDAQTRQLRELLFPLPDRKHDAPIRVLDFGAGRGRLLLNLQRTNSVLLGGGALEWYFWEPVCGLRHELQELAVASDGEGIHVVGDLAEVAGREFDLIVLSNVLHECTPPTIAKILSASAELIHPDAGRLLVMELAPLIRPEKYAVPYSREELEDILRGVGWRCDSGSWPVRGGLVAASWVCGYSPNLERACSRRVIEDVVAGVWDRILARASDRYDGKQRVVSVADQIETLGTLTTIASIVSHRLGRWT